MAKGAFRKLNHDVHDSEPPKKTRLNASKKRHRGEKPWSKERRFKAKLLAMRKPSYCLKRGTANLHDGEGTLRSYILKRLLRLLEECRNRHMWAEACGLLSVLLQATVKTNSPPINRIIYKAVLHLLRDMKDDIISVRRIRKIYDLWTKKLAPFDTKERISVQSEFVIDCMQQGKIEVAHKDAVCLTQLRDFESNPCANWVVGLVFSQLWYTSIPKDMQLTKMGSSITYAHSKIPFDCNRTSNNTFEGGSANFHSNSDIVSSIAPDKVCGVDDRQMNEQTISFGNVKKVPAGSLNGISAEEHGQNPDYTEGTPQTSIFCNKGLPLWLLPMNLPTSEGDLEDAVLAHSELCNDYYKNAVEHLRAAIYLPCPKLEAFLPLIQMLLLGDRVAEALDEVEKFCHTSPSECPLRIKASLLEHFEGCNYAKLSACFEDILMKKPSCSYSLERLIHLHHQGEYDATRLVKMIALHLDASTGTCNAWETLASYLLRLSQSDKDQASTCNNGSDHNRDDILNSNKIPELFTNTASRRVWRVRARWWMKRHFDCAELQKDTTTDDELKMVTSKAAVGSYLYGREFGYVCAVMRRLEKEDNMELHSFLKMHIRNSFGFYCSS